MLFHSGSQTFLSRGTKNRLVLAAAQYLQKSNIC
jgi:hypothetical protein